MNNICILKELKDSCHSKKWLIFLSLSITILSWTTSSKVVASPSFQPDKTTPHELFRINSQEISDKLLLADKNRRDDPQVYKRLLIELSQVTDSFTVEQRYYYQFLQGDLATYRGEYDLADNLFTEILSSSANNLIRFRANYTLISVAAAKKDWSDGLRHIALNKEMLSFIKDEEHYQVSILTAMMFYNQIQQYNLVLKDLALIKRENLSLQHNCFVEQLSLEAKMNLQQIKPDDKSIDAALNICMNAGNKLYTNIIRVYRAKLYLEAHDAGKALTSLLPHYDEINATLYPMLTVRMHNILANSYFKIDNLHNAKKYALEAVKANKYIDAFQNTDSYRLLYLIAKQEKKIDLALSYHEKFSESETERLKGEKSKHLAFQLAKLQTFEHESQITLLNKQNNFLAAEQVLANNKVTNIQQIITVMTFIIIMITLWGARLWRSHKRVKALSEYDELTGIYNRRHFAQVATSALKYCQSAEQDLSLIMFDLDNFKKINDTFGHICGDWALKETIRVCKTIGRKNDIFARLGGEEFCILLPSCNIDAAVLRAEACRAAIENTITEESGNNFTITASFGITDVTRSGFDLEKLLTDADFAAYESKHAGRNRLTVFEPKKDDNEKLLDNSWSVAS
ncbi:GGDEF domain-containing protein [Colwellia sp. 12G3]|uniref:GGDEF domain-containing protein n=1 Tax=Colwellia sp. 12G3 TaxID=2058299 RepID=UPI000C33C3B6|nr:GGDEF domain-containing protein [Colwellia sp. 12G3]PKI17348.1 GGDEF domain-containing protein [Colwellia sp. 12G3]